MQWHDEGIVISARPHGEGHLVLGVFTKNYGYHKGYVFGGSGTKKRPLLQLGNRLDLKWSSRFEDQLGTFTIELLENYASVLFHDPARLCALNTLSFYLGLLPERQPHSRLYDHTMAMMARLRDEKNWHIPFIVWELAFLEAVGFGLDLSECALSQKTSGLYYVSPRTGRAVTATAGADYANRLLLLPSFLATPGQDICLENYGTADILNGFILSGHFLGQVLEGHFCTGLPDIRARMIGYITDSLGREGADKAFP